MKRKHFLLSLLGLILLPGCGGSGEVIRPVPEIAPRLTHTPDFSPNYIQDLVYTSRFDKRRISYRINTNDPGQIDSIESAVDKVRQVIGDLVSLERTDGAETDIDINMVPRESLGGTNERVIGKVYPSEDSRGYRVYVEVRLATGLSGQETENITVHEIYHALGAGGHSPDPDDILYYVSTPPVIITQKDINTLRAIYSSSSIIKPRA